MELIRAPRSESRGSGAGGTQNARSPVSTPAASLSRAAFPEIMKLYARWRANSRFLKRSPLNKGTVKTRAWSLLHQLVLSI